MDALAGHKTGLYLDQVESYGIVAALANGRSVLDCFSNQGGFALACAKAGASAVTAVESGAESVARLRENVIRNEVDVNVRASDVFDFYEIRIAPNTTSLFSTLRRSRRREEKSVTHSEDTGICMPALPSCFLKMARWSPSLVRIMSQGMNLKMRFRRVSTMRAATCDSPAD